MSFNLMWQLVNEKGDIEVDEEENKVTLFYGSKEWSEFGRRKANIVLSMQDDSYVFKKQGSLRNMKIPPKFEDVDVKYLKEIQFIGSSKLLPKGSRINAGAGLQIPSYVSRFRSLVKLDLSHFSYLILDDNSNGIFELKSLEYLRLYNCGLNCIPTKIGNLKALQELNLSYNAILKLPNEIGKLTKLKGLYLRNNLIEELPDGIYSLLSLVELNLYENNLSKLSEKVSNLTQLKQLWLNNNQLTAFPEILTTEMKLEKLDISENQIERIPDSIQNLRALTDLYVWKNKLSCLPDSIGELSQLSEFHCSDNMLTVLPESITKSKSLYSLDIHNNQISSLPNDIGKLTQLEWLNCKDNSLTILPESIADIDLNALEVTGNPLQKPPLEICLKGMKAIKGYFKALNQYKGFHSNRCKILLIGESMAGKSSLCNALIGSKGEEIDVANRTEGIDLCPWTIRRSIDETQPLEALLIDCAGQRRYIITHQLFFTRGSLFLLVVDLSSYETTKESYEINVGVWVNLILAHAPTSPIIIVPTHVDLFEKDDYNVQKRCEHILKSLWDDEKARAKSSKKQETDDDLSNQNVPKRHISSCLFIGSKILDLEFSESLGDHIRMIPVSTQGHLTGMTELRDEIISVLTNEDIMPFVGRILPTVYADLEALCVQMKDATPFIKSNDLMDMARKRFQMTKEMMIPALQYLDGTGSLLYFTKFKGLSQYVFLNPEWFINVLKAIFTHRIEDKLIYDEAYLDCHDIFPGDFTQFKDDLIGNARLDTQLLRCIWLSFGNISNNEDMFNLLVEILCHFNFFMKINNNEYPSDNSSLFLLVPWFLKSLTDDEKEKYWSTDMKDNMIQITCQLDSTAAFFPPGLFENFIANIHHIFPDYIAWADALLGLQSKYHLLCSIHGIGRHRKILFEGRCIKKNIKDLWQALLLTIKLTKEFLKGIPGLGSIKCRSLCPSCVSNNSTGVPSMFDLEDSSKQTDNVWCKKEHKEIPLELVYPSRDSRTGVNNKEEKQELTPKVYTMSREPRGLCIIINNVTFHQKSQMEERKGSNRDVERLTETMEELKFMTKEHRNLKANEIYDLTNELAFSHDHSNYDCFIMCILSHGKEDHIFGVDGNSVHIEHIRRKFGSCPSLLGKPKWFIIQACQGTGYTMRVTSDCLLSKLQPTMYLHSDSNSAPICDNDDTDWLVWIGATPGKRSWRSETEGSWFIFDVCCFLNEFALTKSILDIFILMNDEVSQREGQTGISEPNAYANYQSRHSMRRIWYLTDDHDLSLNKSMNLKKH